MLKSILWIRARRIACLCHCKGILVLLGWFLIWLDVMWLSTLGGGVILMFMWCAGGTEECGGPVSNKLTLMLHICPQINHILTFSFTCTKLFTFALPLSLSISQTVTLKVSLGFVFPSLSFGSFNPLTLFSLYYPPIYSAFIIFLTKYYF